MSKSQDQFLLASTERLRAKAGAEFTSTNLEPATEVIPVFRTITQEVQNRPEGPNADVDDIRNIDIHAVPLTEVLIRLGAVSIEDGGLNDFAAAERLKKNGPNILKPPKERYILKFLGFYFGGFCLLMWCAAAIIFLTYYPLPQMDGTIPSPYNLAVVIMILIVILFQGTFYAWQDWSSSSVMGKINGLLASEAHVIRGGRACDIPAENLVVGDIVELKLGSKVPADCVILECSSDLAMDRSILTGESVAVSATNRTTDASFMESKNVGFMGTTVVNGAGKAVVVATGDSTIMGRIATLSGKKRTERTLLQKEIDKFIIFVATIAVTCGATCMLVWKYYLMTTPNPQYTLLGMLNNMCAIIVAFVPEGLPVAMSVTLTLIARRMAKQFVLVKNLTTIETLGSVSIICTDKTGTLTSNKMTLRDISFAGIVGNVESVSSKAKNMFHAVAAQCCGADFKDDSSVSIPDRPASGDATDIAVLRAAESMGPVEPVRRSFKKLFEIPFNSRNKWMLTIQQASSNHDCFPGSTLFIKGAPDVLLSKITKALAPDGTIVAFEAEIRTRVIQTQEQWSSEGKRVIAFAYRPVEFNTTSEKLSQEEQAMQSISDLVLVGMGAIVDPPRPETRATIDTCRTAHIRVAMVTGDFKLTAVAIAREVNIITANAVDSITTMRNRSSSEFPSYPDTKPSRLSRLSKKVFKTTTPIQVRAEISEIEESNRAIAVSGSEIADLSESDWDRICLYRELVFARTSPEQKLKIVDEFKARGEVVAVTGDGVNDSPALKAANVGVAMGGGSEVAMEAASLVLIDNNFSSLLAGIESGRLCFDNIKKVIMYLIPCGTWSELWPVLLSIFIGIPLPLNTAMDLVICCITDVFPSMALIYESPESTLMTRPPRVPTKDCLVNGKMFAHVYLFIGLMQTFCAHALWFTYWYRSAGVSFSDLVFMYGKLAADPVTFPSGVQVPAAEYTQHLYNANSVYFVALVIMQICGNLYAVRTRHNSIFQQNPFWGPTRNLYLPAAGLISLCVAIFFVYTPGFNSLFQTGPIPVEYWFLPLPCAMFVLLMDEVRKMGYRRFGPHSLFGKLCW